MPVDQITQNSMNLAEWVKMLVPVAALIWFILSFWHWNWRKGHLVVSIPRSYCLCQTKDGLIVELPFSFYNTGAPPIVIDNLLLRLRHRNAEALLRFHFTRNALSDSSHQYATQIAVDGRKAVFNVYSFKTKITNSGFEAGVWDAYLLAKIDGNKKYKELLQFKLNVSQMTEKLIPYDNYDEEYKKMVVDNLKSREINKYQFLPTFPLPHFLLLQAGQDLNEINFDILSISRYY